MPIIFNMSTAQTLTHQNSKFGETVSFETPKHKQRYIFMRSLTFTTFQIINLDILQIFWKLYNDMCFFSRIELSRIEFPDDGPTWQKLFRKKVLWSRRLQTIFRLRISNLPIVYLAIVVICDYWWHVFINQFDIRLCAEFHVCGL